MIPDLDSSHWSQVFRIEDLCRAETLTPAEVGELVALILSLTATADDLRKELDLERSISHISAHETLTREADHAASPLERELARIESVVERGMKIVKNLPPSPQKS